MLLPTLAPGTGPFPNATGDGATKPSDWYERRAAACLYAALVADTSLDLIGSRERLLVEGRFAEAEVFVRALAALAARHDGLHRQRAQRRLLRRAAADRPRAAAARASSTRSSRSRPISPPIATAGAPHVSATA